MLTQCTDWSGETHPGINPLTCPECGTPMPIFNVDPDQWGHWVEYRCASGDGGWDVDPHENAEPELVK
jgi:hypothetical protein